MRLSLRDSLVSTFKVTSKLIKDRCVRDLKSQEFIVYSLLSSGSQKGPKESLIGQKVYVRYVFESYKTCLLT